MEGDGSYGLLATCGRDRKGHSPIEICKFIPIVNLGLIVDQRALRFRDLAGPAGILSESCPQSSKKQQRSRNDAFHFEFSRKLRSKTPFFRARASSLLLERHRGAKEHTRGDEIDDRTAAVAFSIVDTQIAIPRLQRPFRFDFVAEDAGDLVIEQRTGVPPTNVSPYRN